MFSTGADSAHLDPFQRRETRVFAHAAAETQSTIYDSISHSSRPGTTGRPVTSSYASVQETGFLEVFPRVASRPPRLLSELEALLSDKMRNNDKAASLTPISGKERDPKMASNLSLDAHRQVFLAFALGFTTYSALLASIQGQFESSLREGLRCSVENVGMRQRIKSEEDRRAAAALEVRANILAQELPLRQATAAKLADLKERSARALRRAAAAERELQDLKREEQQLEAACVEMREKNLRVQEITAGDERWLRAPASAPAQGMRIGPLTHEDEAYLEQELGLTHQVGRSAAAAEAALADLPSELPTRGLDDPVFSELSRMQVSLLNIGDNASDSLNTARSATRT